MDIEYSNQNQSDFPPFMKQIGAYLRNPNQGQESWDDFKQPPPIKIDAKQLTLKPIQNIQSRVMAFTETENKIVFAFAIQLQPEPGEADLEAVQVNSFNKAEGKRQKRRICEIKSKITCMQLGLTTIQRQEIISLTVGIEEGSIYFFAFASELICKNLKLLSFPITHLCYCRQNDNFEARSIIAVGGQDQSILLINCQQMSIIAHLKEGNIHSRKPVSLYFSQSYKYIIMGLSDGCVRFWSISGPLRDKVIKSYERVDNEYRGILPKYSLSSAAVKGLVAVEDCNSNLMLLTADNHLKLICVDIEDEEAYLTFFDFKIQSETIASWMQVIGQKQQVYVAVGYNLMLIGFDANGVWTVRNHSIPALGALKIDRFFLNYQDQSYLGILAEQKFFIGQIAKPKSSIKEQLM